MTSGRVEDGGGAHPLPGRMPEAGATLHDVVVVAADALAAEQSGRHEIGDDPVAGALGDADSQREIANRHLGLAGEAGQNVAVVGQQREAALPPSRARRTPLLTRRGHVDILPVGQVIGSTPPASPFKSIPTGSLGIISDGASAHFTEEKRMKIATPAALAGAADTAAFLIGRPTLVRENPGRAAGGVALLGLWVVAARQASGGGRAARLATAAALTAANAGLLAAHLRARIATPRIFAGMALSAVVLADAVRARG